MFIQHLSQPLFLPYKNPRKTPAKQPGSLTQHRNGRIIMSRSKNRMAITPKCDNCPKHTAAILRTPKGRLCPDCFWLLYVKPVQDAKTAALDAGTKELVAA